MSITVFPQSIAKQIQTDKLVFSQTANKLIFVTSTDKEIFTIYKPVDYIGNFWVLRITARYINIGSSGYNSATVNLTEYSKREVQNSQYFPVNVDRND